MSLCYPCVISTDSGCRAGSWRTRPPGWIKGQGGRITFTTFTQLSSLSCRIYFAETASRWSCTDKKNAEKAPPKKALSPSPKVCWLVQSCADLDENNLDWLLNLPGKRFKKKKTTKTENKQCSKRSSDQLQILSSSHPSPTFSLMKSTTVDPVSHYYWPYLN